MTLTITLELPPDAEAELQARIAQRDAAGIHRLLADALGPTVEAMLQQPPDALSDEEFERLTQELVDEVAACTLPGMPPLSDCAISRESIYEGRG